MDAENFPEYADENQVTKLSEDVVEVRKVKLPTNTRGEKYNLRPNPNPSISVSYRY